MLKALNSLSPVQRFEHSFIEPFRIERAIRAYEDLIDKVLASAARKEPRL
jgi:hypothetical protein